MKSRSKELLDRAIAATVAAIEIYNKPDFQYRAETFCILAINGWELLLKAKWLSENRNKIRSLYVMETRQNKDGSKSKRSTIKRTHSGNPFTHSLAYIAKKLVEQKHLDRVAMDNIETLLELRNSSVHFYNQSNTEFAKRLQEIGAASLKNFVLAVKEWFARDLSKFNFYLMPLSFMNLPKQTDAVVLNKEEKNFLKYLREIEAKVGETDTGYAITINIDVKFTGSKARDATGVQLTKDSDAIEIRLTDEQIRERYPWDYKKLTSKCRNRYADFKCDAKYHGIRESLLKNEKFAHIRYLDPDNPKSQEKKLYNPIILQEIDKYYQKYEKSDKRS